MVELPGKDSFPDFISETDYNLVRVPFDATKFTRGVAPVDIPDRENPFMATEYVTDMFQRLFHEEVSPLLAYDPLIKVVPKAHSFVLMCILTLFSFISSPDRFLLALCNTWAINPS